MEFYREPCKEIPVTDNVDVLVIGGGPAGFGAAVAAARAGADTLLLEQSPALGGVATMGMMSHWTGLTSGPILDELRNRAKSADRDYNYYGAKVLKAENIINTENTRLTMMRMLREAGARWRLFTLSTRAVTDGGRVVGVITESKAGRGMVSAKIVVDATGDGDIAASAGVAGWIGREQDNSMQPMTVMFRISGVDFEQAVFPGEFDDYIPIEGGNIQEVGKAVLPHPIGHVLLYPSVFPGVVTVNMTNSLGKSGLSPDDMTEADFECRQQIPVIIDFLRKHVPGYGECRLLQTAAAVGVRETRHFKGLYTLTEEDILKARTFDDWVATRCWFNFDVHNMTGSGLDATGVQNEFSQSKPYTIPLGCLIPESVDGLLLSGRNISGTHLAHSNFRVMPICLNIGQGAGAAAAACVRDGVQPRNVPIAHVQAILRDQGVTP